MKKYCTKIRNIVKLLSQNQYILRCTVWHEAKNAPQNTTRFLFAHSRWLWSKQFALNRQPISETNFCYTNIRGRLLNLG